MNRGPDSLGTLRLLRELDAEPVLGNHDLHLLHVARGMRELSPRDTLDEVLGAPDADELLEWLAAQPFARAVGDCLVVHAGLHRDWADPVAHLAGRDPFTEDPDVAFATRVRTCRADGTPAEPGTPEEEQRPWYELRPSGPGETVVFGHWAVQGLLVRPGLRGLDSGCVWGGALSAWIAEEDRVVDVPARRAWCRHG